jgi:hypothetical protein
MNVVACYSNCTDLVWAECSHILHQVSLNLSWLQRLVIVGAKSPHVHMFIFFTKYLSAFYKKGKKLFGVENTFRIY